jgi:hypothetical protein
VFGTLVYSSCTRISPFSFNKILLLFFFLKKKKKRKRKKNNAYVASVCISHQIVLLSTAIMPCGTGIRLNEGVMYLT